ncbi:MAG: class I SAM-dependent methyltransferase [Thermofilaceae archaeon]
MSKHEYLNRLYRVFPWPEDPSTAEGLRRYQTSVSELETVVKHEWFKEFLNKRRMLKVIDVCSGTGIGGIALAKVLRNIGVEVTLTLLDLRREALDKAVDFCSRELGFMPNIVECDIIGADLGAEFNVALLWGFTTPHFSPWDWIKVLSSVSRLLVSDGLFVYEETDRVYTTHLVGYKEVLPELVEKERVVLTIHKGKDFKSGYVTRLAFDLVTREREEMKVYFWDLAASAAFTWVFFNNVDFIATRRPYSGLVIARNPRRTLNLEVLLGEKLPKLLCE